jgi:hypothetical protein
MCAVAVTSGAASCGGDKNESGDSFDATGDGAGDGGQPDGGSDGGGNGDDGGGGGGDGSDGGDGGDGEDDGGILYDVGNDGTGEANPEGEDEICGKVDFLFVIDNSESMLAHQQNLVANFPAFITGIQDTLEEVDDYQVGVISTDEYVYAGGDCGSHLSGLVSSTPSGGYCGPFADGGNYMTHEDDLAATFPCAAQLGAAGDYYEKPMQALVEAVQEPLDAPGLCNEGFLREDSLLVVVVITDEADGPGDNEYGGSLGDADAWFADVVAARSGIESNIVVLTLTNYYYGPCEPWSEGFDGQNMVDFTDMFTHGFVGGICVPDYGPYFQEAIAVIDVACDEYTPVG